MIDDPDRCYAAVCARDPRFDGWFVMGVTSTGIYCRPSCPARTPSRVNVRFHATAAAARSDGFRACKRCRPDASPGSPAYDHRADVVARALRAIADGEVERSGVAGLAAGLGYSSRHLHRQLVAEVGAGPQALARAERARTARMLLEATDLPVAEVAFAAGFASVRQFNATIQQVLATTPSALRWARRRPTMPMAAASGPAASGPAASGHRLTVRLVHRRPMATASLLGHLAGRAVTGLEQPLPDGHRRSLVTPHGGAVATLTPDDGAVSADLVLDDPRDLSVVVARLRRLLDLDSDPVAVDTHLAADPGLAPHVRRHPGLRLPGTVDGTELAARAVLGQQVSVAAAATLAGRLVTAYGVPLSAPVGAVTHRFPSADVLAGASVDDLRGLGLTGGRARTLQAVAHAIATGGLDLTPGTDRRAALAALGALPGVGPWTTAYVALRALHDPDAFPAGDLVLRRSAGASGLPADARGLAAHAQRWRPWRGYAAQHLWTAAAEARRARAA